ncbi:hypothetical protein EDB89DRAFT_534088 [Lactarius sanguifluus]|nr:hypothetical protein EDB89DRAFT_534088 [Lactarius sanguifluus]
MAPSSPLGPTSRCSRARRIGHPAPSGSPDGYRIISVNSYENLRDGRFRNLHFFACPVWTRPVQRAHILVLGPDCALRTRKHAIPSALSRKRRVCEPCIAGVEQRTQLSFARCERRDIRLGVVLRLCQRRVRSSYSFSCCLCPLGRASVALLALTCTTRSPASSRVWIRLGTSAAWRVAPSTGFCGHDSDSVEVNSKSETRVLGGGTNTIPISVSWYMRYRYKSIRLM